MRPAPSLGHTGRGVEREQCHAGHLWCDHRRSARAHLRRRSPGASDLMLHVAALAWVAAFLGFALVFGPILFSRDPRQGRAPHPTE